MLLILCTFEDAFTSLFIEYIAEPADPIRALSEVKDRIDTKKVQIAAISKKIHNHNVQLKSQQSLLETKYIDHEHDREELYLQNQELKFCLVTHSKTVNDLRQMILSQEQYDHNATMLEEAASKEANLLNEVKKRTQEDEQLQQNVNKEKQRIIALR